ncbi:hypothetical protein FHT80_000068 [Rhizobium sp. BK226]|uniref:hypothetical protein n=1 Tax=Rhizobium TaxID=379 RepID=UPI00161232FE|nr:MULTISPECIES: hypothetical protein [Rhizobium]MBB3297338.1 hypothetical protein [Rhizobium sp. BK112]MBB3368499.1 hypothetical protein [Rhizobium sp. BK077]MBB4110765.1 hypothetical protein [Rhizobium sp. BK226]MBB4177231.1 hypothetical protein [Rhizobium sp. BK109]UTS89593.1 hypothetical protein NE851_23660 [Rhizobium anhuiense bv. trifolii]
MILPAESNSELATMFLLDISISVLTYMAQPHLLEFRVNGKKREYTPDIEAVVPLWFVEQLLDGVPFVKTALKMAARRAVDDPLITVVLECKNGRGNESQEYIEKLEEASDLYYRYGYYYFILDDCLSADINCDHLPSILMDESAIVDHSAIRLALQHLEQNGGFTTYAAMMEAVGGGPLGREITNYLHIKGLIWADFSSDPLMREHLTTVAMPPLLGPQRQAMARFAQQE